VVPSSSAETCRFHITQPELLYQWKRSGMGAQPGVAGLQVEVEGVQLEHLEHHAAVAVHDGLGQPGGAAGIDDPQRVREGHRLGRGTRSLPASASAQPSTRPAQPASVEGERAAGWRR
jgi:hypothetical protein